MAKLVDDLIARLLHEYDACDTKDLICKMDDRIHKADNDVYAAYQRWPSDIKAKLSFHDLRRMNGWVPQESGESQ